jgi:spermidine synthase
VALLFLAGLLGIGHEVLAVRVLAQVTENTVYTFSLALAVYLAGTGIGAALYQARYAASPRPAQDRDRFSVAVCLAILASVPALAWSPSWLHASAGAGVYGALLRETALCAAAFLLPSIAMGLLFARLCVDARDAGISLGTALGANTIGAALAPPLFGIVLLPAAGPLAALSAVAAAYLCLSGVRGARQAPRWAALAAGVALAAGPVSLRIADVPPGGRLLSHRDGILGTVSVVEDADGVRRLHINNRQQEGSNVTGLVDGRLAYLPLMLHPAPASMLFLGMGTGVTARAAAREDGLDVDVVELLPEVVDASAYFANGAALPRNLHVHVADARRYVRTAGRQYDVIVADLFHPARSGTAALYTVEHYRAVRSRLAPDGVFCQWIALHQMDLETLRGIVRAFLDVYPQGYAMLASNSLETPVIGLVARAHAGPAPAPWRLAAARSRLEGARDGSRLQALQLYDEYALLGSFVAGPAALGAFSRGTPPNTDDRQTVAYGAPRATYAPQTAPRARLLAFMRQAAISPDELAPMAAPEGPDRLRAYLDGRARFLELGARVRPGADVHAMLDQVEEPLLAIAAGSPEFRPAYDPLIAMAQALSEAEPQAGRRLLERIRAAQPGRPEAAELLRRMSP